MTGRSRDAARGSFSSSLDVAAIEMEIGHPLDYDHELKTVGISNAISGALGGYTGSYIFSQTLFTFRTGTRSRACGGLVLVSQVRSMSTPPRDGQCPYHPVTANVHTTP